MVRKPKNTSGAATPGSRWYCSGGYLAAHFHRKDQKKWIGQT